MVQTTLFSYILYNKRSTKQTAHKIKQLKQTILQDYFSVTKTNYIKKEKVATKNTILCYFKPVEKEKEKEKKKKKKKKKKKIFNLVLVDIEKTLKKTYDLKNMDIACLKKNMYDKDLNYIAISYRWGEMNEQLVQTPDYRAHVTSFDLRMLTALCKCIKKEPDLKNIQYLWIDAISVDQLNHERKKETILQMSEIYKRATYILAVPDLHGAHLWKNPANKDAIILIRKHRKTIYKDILNYSNNNYHQLVYEKEKKKYIKNNYFPYHQSSNDKEIQTENEDIKTAYQFLAYLVEDWSNRAWVISEYHIAKEKDESKGTPLKYIFVNLLHDEISTFFSYSFDHHSLTKAININYNNNTNTNKVSYGDVDSPIKFISFLKTKFTQQDHLKMILESNASRNEDRFNAILPSWKKYNHWIKDKNTVSDWNITDMISVRLKLYELMDDLWDKATLLYACSWSTNSPILPSYASQFYSDHLCLFEMENTEIAYEIYLTQLKEIAMDTFGNSNFIQHIINNNNKKTKYPSLYAENLINIHLDLSQRCLSIKANKYFIIKNKPLLNQEFLATYSLKNGDDDDDLCLIWVPFFTFTIPCFTHIPPLIGSGVYLLGNIDQNRWIILSRNKFYRIKMDMSCASNNYTFNIY